ncbi:hypothetical protein AEB_P0511 [Altererythrobacter sp. B11]|nr:hypothetical protein AEB_P0511 [Altererythrobacter sp. B11]
MAVRETLRSPVFGSVTQAETPSSEIAAMLDTKMRDFFMRCILMLVYSTRSTGRRMENAT